MHWPRDARESVRTGTGPRECRIARPATAASTTAFDALVARANGPYLWDAEGNRYVDYVLSWGPMILGQVHPEVVEAVREQIGTGMSFGALWCTLVDFGAPCAPEADLAERIIAMVPSIEMVRFVSSGTEATMSAVRLARAATGRAKIIKFAGWYHGHGDFFLVQEASGFATLGLPDSPGVTPGVTPGTVADTLTALATKIGAILLFDEVMTGFRLSLGGAQERFGVMPDITTLGKVIGGGMPVGAYGGRKDLMQHVVPAGMM